MQIDFLSVDDVLFIHSNQIKLYGGEDGVRDVGMLESAVSQPRAGFDGKYLHDSIYDMAAAYLYHIVNNHPFVDGNKRTGVVAAFIFLDINGIKINAPVGSVYEITIGVASGKISKAEVVEYFKLNCD